MKLIAYISTPGGLTGAPRRLLNLASCLKEFGFEVCIATRQDSELFLTAKSMGLETTSVEVAGTLGSRKGNLFAGGLWFQLRVIFDLLRQNWRLLRCVCRQNGDVVWLRGSKGIAFAALGVLLSRRPLVWDVDYELPSRGIVRWLHRLGLRTANLVVFQYAAAADEIFDQELAIRYRHKFQTIIPGIDLAALEPLAAHRKAKPREDNPPFVILQVGTICDRKNQALTIEALRLADKGGWDNHWELWLAYDEIQDPDFEQRLLEQGLEDNVKLLGWRNDVKELMVRANILVMPSKDEGVPNAVQEAMAIGLPVLVSSSGGMPEIIVDGKTGWILDVDDPTAWAQQIHWCRDNLNANEAIGQNASAFAFKYFSTDHWGAEYARIIAEQLSHQLSKGKH